MKNKLVAKELLSIARDLVAIEFPTQEAYDKYMKEHPEADKSNHSIKKNNWVREPISPEDRAETKKYMKEHPEADKSNHRVVETKKEPVKRDEEDINKRQSILQRHKDKVNAEFSDAFRVNKKRDFTTEERDAMVDYARSGIGGGATGIFMDLKAAIKNNDSEKISKIVKDAKDEIDKMEKVASKLPVDVLKNGAKGIKKYHEYLRKLFDQIDITK